MKNFLRNLRMRQKMMWAIIHEMKDQNDRQITRGRLSPITAAESRPLCDCYIESEMYNSIISGRMFASLQLKLLHHFGPVTAMEKYDIFLQKRIFKIQKKFANNFVQVRAIVNNNEFEQAIHQEICG